MHVSGHRGARSRHLPAIVDRIGDRRCAPKIADILDRPPQRSRAPQPAVYGDQPAAETTDNEKAFARRPLGETIAGQRAPRKRPIERSRVRHGPCDWARRPRHGEGSARAGVWQRASGAWESAGRRVRGRSMGLKRRSETQESIALRHADEGADDLVGEIGEGDQDQWECAEKVVSSVWELPWEGVPCEEHGDGRKCDRADDYGNRPAGSVKAVPGETLHYRRRRSRQHAPPSSGRGSRAGTWRSRTRLVRRRRWVEIARRFLLPFKTVGDF